MWKKKIKKDKKAALVGAESSALSVNCSREQFANQSSMFPNIWITEGSHRYDLWRQPFYGLVQLLPATSHRLCCHRSPQWEVFTLHCSSTGSFASSFQVLVRRHPSDLSKMVWKNQISMISIASPVHLLSFHSLSLGQALLSAVFPFFHRHSNEPVLPLENVSREEAHYNGCIF